jgi:hypothetical protein
VLRWTIPPECVTDSFGGCPRTPWTLRHGWTPPQFGSSRRRLSSPHYSLAATKNTRRSWNYLRGHQVNQGWRPGPWSYRPADSVLERVAPGDVERVVALEPRGNGRHGEDDVQHPGPHTSADGWRWSHATRPTSRPRLSARV